jgi:hypothetical protein
MIEPKFSKFYLLTKNLLLEQLPSYRADEKLSREEMIDVYVKAVSNLF